MKGSYSFNSLAGPDRARFAPPHDELVAFFRTFIFEPADDSQRRAEAHMMQSFPAAYAEAVELGPIIETPRATWDALALRMSKAPLQ